jgi:hypothetical protein
MAGLPDFSWYNVPKRGKDIPNSLKFNKWPQNIPNSHKIAQIDQHLPLRDPPKFTQIGIFGLKKMLSGNPASTCGYNYKLKFGQVWFYA